MSEEKDGPRCLDYGLGCYCWRGRGHGGFHECLCAISWAQQEDDDAA